VGAAFTYSLQRWSVSSNCWSCLPRDIHVSWDTMVKSTRRVRNGRGWRGSGGHETGKMSRLQDVQHLYSPCTYFVAFTRQTEEPFSGVYRQIITRVAVGQHKRSRSIRPSRKTSLSPQALCRSCKTLTRSFEGRYQHIRRTI
jgi:hypothetical protein